MIYHAEFYVKNTQFFMGGYFGVDVFFVISGYLITSLIINEYQKTGKFSLAKFYERRARRLLPALLTVIIVTVPFAWKILLPSQFDEFFKSIIASLGFSSNFYWLAILHEYGAESSLLKPFLHTWSLAVEEQYYIIFPLLFIWIYRKYQQFTLEILLGLFFVSLLFAEFITGTNKSFSFYMLPARFWEMLIGAMLAYILYTYPDKHKHVLLTKTLPMLGLCMIIAATLFFDFQVKHPGLITLVPVVGTVLIIWFANPDELVTKILSTKIFVGIGLISYSLYLWHYPIYALGRIIDNTPSLLTRSIWILMTFLLSYLTYKFIENPFRNRQLITVKKLVFSTSILTVFIVALGLYVIQNNGLRSRFPQLVKIYEKNEFDNTVLRRTSQAYLTDALDKHDFNELWFSNNKNTTKVLIIGNSHGLDMYKILNQNTNLFKQTEFAYYHTQVCSDESINKMLTTPNFEKADIVLISTAYENRRQCKVGDLSSMPKLIRLLKINNKHVVVTSQSPLYKGFSVEQTLFDTYVTTHATFDNNAINSFYYENRLRPNEIKTLNHRLNSISKKLRVTYLDKYKYMCNDNKQQCYGITDDGYKVHYDGGHVTMEGAKFFGQKIYETGWLKLN